MAGGSARTCLNPALILLLFASPAAAQRFAAAISDDVVETVLGDADKDAGDDAAPSGRAGSADE